MQLLYSARIIKEFQDKVKIIFLVGLGFEVVILKYLYAYESIWSYVTFEAVTFHDSMWMLINTVEDISKLTCKYITSWNLIKIAIKIYLYLDV